MLFKKILSFTLAAALSSTMIAAVPTVPTMSFGSNVSAATVTTTTVAGGNTFALLSTLYTVQVGETITLNRCGTAMPDSWEVENEDIISVDSTGLEITGLADGLTVITYHTGDTTVKANISVYEGTVLVNPDAFHGTTTTTTTAPPESFALMYNTYTANVGDDIYIAICGTGRPDSWTVDNEDVISVNTTGNKAKALKAGKATITYNYQGISTNAYITVTDPAVQEKAACANCGKEYPIDELTKTDLDMLVCHDCIDCCWSGTISSCLIEDTVTDIGDTFICFADYGKYNYTRAVETQEDMKLADLRVNDRVVIGFTSYETYDRFIDHVGTLRKATDTTTTPVQTTALDLTTTTTLTTDTPTCVTSSGFITTYVDDPTLTTMTTDAPTCVTSSGFTTTYVDDPTLTTTTTEPEVWMWMTGVDHFDSIKTLPTKVIYNEGEELDLSGLVINAYHLADKVSNKGRSMTVRTDYVWEIESIDPKYITVEDLSGTVVAADGDISKLRSKEAYTVIIGGGQVMQLKAKGDQYEKTLYDTNEFRFRIYISPKDGAGKFIAIDNAEVESFSYGYNNKGFRLKEYGEYSVDMDSIGVNAGYNFDSRIMKGDIVSGVLYVSTKDNYVYFGDLEIVDSLLGNGDTNCDGKVELADAILIMQALANPNKYNVGGTYEHCLTAAGKANADVNGGGMTVDDALDIQLHLLNINHLRKL